TAVEATIEKAPDSAPEVPAGGPSPSTEDKMILKLARDELMGGDPYSLDPGYAGRLLSLGDAGLPALKACADSPHAILRRNATALLGFCPGEEPPVVLRKLLREDKDAVVRTRALFHLVHMKDKEIVPDLLKGLESSENKRYPALCAWGLGVIGHPDAV